MIQTKRKSQVNLSLLYDILYDKADKLIKQYKPCNIVYKNDKLCCALYTNGNMSLEYKNCLCCIFHNVVCKYHSDIGCTTKNLYCKLHLCEYAQAGHKQLCDALYYLKRVAHRYYLLEYFLSKEEILQRSQKMLNKCGAYK